MRNRNSLLIAILLGLVSSAGYSQGVLPPLSNALTASTAPVTTLLIGQKVPENVVVLDQAGKSRTLLSFKAPLELLVVYVTSGSCEAEGAVVGRYKRLYEKYKEWRVAFVELRNGRPAAPGTWDFPKVTDTTGRVHSLLGVQGTPMLFILDEGGVLRFRGTLDDGSLFNTKASKALEAVIGHVQPVSDPEPQPTFLCPAP